MSEGGSGNKIVKE